MKRSKLWKPQKPRNPVLLPALFKKAGKHGRTKKAQRRKDKIELEKEKQ